VVYHIDIVIKHRARRDNGRANTISRRPNLIHDLTEVTEDLLALKINPNGNLIPAEALISILVTIMEDPTELSKFKEVYLEDPGLEK
jgi:hypothetical protein